MRVRFDKLGIAIALLAAYGALWSSFAVLKPNRIVQGQAESILQSLPTWAGWSLIGLLVIATAVALFRTSPWIKLLAAVAALAALTLAIGYAASFLTPAGNTYARVSPASGFWILLFAFALLAADAITRLEPPPGMRVLFLILAAIGIGALLMSGSWSGLSIMKEYSGRADVFWIEAGKHVELALGSLFAAVLVGLPLGILCHRVAPLRDGVLNTLNLVQTIPSIALFGLLIAPLGWIAANVPGPRRSASAA